MSEWYRRRRMAEHEACHAIVAQRMGLPVAWASIEFGLDEGIQYHAAVKLPDELIDQERDRFAICVATCAPSFLISHQSDEDLWRYATMEADLAYTIAGKHGIDPDDVYDKAADLVDEHHVEIMELAERLDAEGRVVFQTV